jgi:succinylglutamic semialdehyde dehydrogenase
MGGNNPLVVHKVHNRNAAVLLTLQSAFLTAGQRCTCARRLIIKEGKESDAFIDDLIEVASAIRVGSHTDRPEPFMGPVISASAAQSILAAQAEWVRKGAVPRLEARHLKAGTCLLSPGIIDVTEMTDRGDEEVFGPLLQVVRVADFDAAIDEADNTAYGLAAGLISDDATCYESFRRRVGAGLINWNQQLTGASGAVPFGGIGMSGNHRPSGFFAADYCSTPVASIEVPEVTMPASLPPGLVEGS